MDLKRWPAVPRTGVPAPPYTGDYWDGLNRAALGTGRARAARVAILGNAGGTSPGPTALLLPQPRSTAVEIDGDAHRSGVGRYPRPAQPRMTLPGGPLGPGSRLGRRLRRILVDALPPAVIPFYLTTEEFFRLDRRPPRAVWGGERQRRPS